VVPVRRVILTRAAFEWPSLAIHTSRASRLGIFKGELRARAKAKSEAGESTSILALPRKNIRFLVRYRPAVLFGLRMGTGFFWRLLAGAL
jgi:hypothetical protein